jgi:hypothetical protein
MLVHAVEFGLVLSGLIATLVVVTYLVDKTVWLNDVSEGRLPGNETGSAIVGLTVLVSAVGLMLATSVSWAIRQPHSFIDLVVVAFVAFQVFNLIDLVLIDGLLYHLAHPACMRFEGVPKLPFTKHLRDALNGLVIGAVLALVVAGITAGLVAAGVVRRPGGLA